MSRIEAVDYKRARTELRASCPSRSFPAINNNCWVDSTMYGLTYAPDIGQVMRAALLGCLDNLEAARISTRKAFYNHVNNWNLTPIWKTFVTRMLLYFLLGEKALKELTCPLVNSWVEDLRKRTFDIAKQPLQPIGGIALYAISAILTALSVDDDIVVESLYPDGYRNQYYGKDYVQKPVKPLDAYIPRIAHLTVEGEGIAHIVVAFVCDGTLWLFDNNFGIAVFSELSDLPTDFTLHYTHHKIGSQWFVHKVAYTMTAGGKSQTITKTVGSSTSKETKEETQKLINTITLYTKKIYDRVRKGDDILATMLGAPTAKRLTISPSTPRIGDVLSHTLVETMESSRLSRSSTSSKSSHVVKQKGRLTKFASCIRDMSATVPYKRTQLFNAPDWKADPQQLSFMSSKFTTLLETIRRVDEADMKKHGRLFKHFIFTDLRKAASGAKAIGTFMAAHGYELLFKAQKGYRRRAVLDANKKPVKGVDGKPMYQMVPVKKLKITLGPHNPIEGGSNRVGLLQGNTMWQSQLGIDIRKQMLGIFNSRPDNIHGEQIRFMILDSKFKEGIDLYDVKYVHLMEPAITEADLKQAIGRATRYCGQRGLQFVPNMGWKLEVFLYETEFDNAYPFRQEGSDRLFDAHNYMMAHSGMDLGLLEMTRDLTVLAIKSAVDYDLTYKINNFKIQSEIHDLTALEDAVVLSVNPQTGGVTSVKPAAEVDRSKCMPRSNKFFPFTVNRIQEAFRLRGIKLSKTDRKSLCTLLEDHEEVMQDLLTGARHRYVKAKANAKAMTKTPSPEPAVTPTVTPTMTPSKSGTPASNGNSLVGLPRSPYYELFPVPEKPRRLTKAELEEMPDLADFFSANELAVEANQAMRQASFSEFQAFIRDRYGKYGWAAPVVKSACESTPPMGEPVQFSQSQDFVRHYLTPESPFAGLLAWHSVGTGKTCTAVATATTEFEKAGYSILWVTRNSLMADVWKNIFGAVCSISVQNYIKAGKKVPTQKATRRRILSKAWFDPISYRTLQNALIPVESGPRKGQTSKLGKVLRDRNGTDPLRKTFLIIDEVHKLLDGDLKASEKADFEKIAAAIHHSYKVSGKDAVKVLLMTATPITDNPEGLFKLLNLLIPQEGQRLPTVESFRSKYTDNDGSITQEGQAFFQSRVKGLISYLNREFDPSAFAQPHFQQVKIAASGADLQSDFEILRDCVDDQEDEELDCDADALKAELAESLDDLKHTEIPKKELAARKRTLKADYSERIRACKERIRAQKVTRKGQIRQAGLCIAAKAKTRKLIWRLSQQKAVKKCFGDSAFGEPPAFTHLSVLKKQINGFQALDMANNF